jgi:two-component system, OmpR family, phosphate regulon sensor histidine kinase PhoR
MTTKSLFAVMAWPWTEKRIAEVERQQAQARDGIDQIVAALPEPVLVLDEEARVIKANALAQDALEAAKIGEHVSQSLRAPAVLDAVTEILMGAPAQHADYEQRGRVTRQFDVRISPIAGSSPGGAHVLLMLKDVTREQQVERMRSDFVANASHELRTPLTSLLGFIETLMGAARNDTAARDKFLPLMRDQATRMKRLIDELLSLSRIEMNAHIRPSGRADLGTIAASVVDSLMPIAKEAGIKIALTSPEALVVEGDSDELTQVVTNLLENAIKYSKAGTRVELIGGRDGAYVTLAVADHGPGISPEHIPRLTERFYRVNVQQSRSRGGTGLGLAIVKHILNRHRGRLTIESEVGKGSVFAIRLPAV